MNAIQNNLENAAAAVPAGGVWMAQIYGKNYLKIIKHIFYSRHTQNLLQILGIAEQRVYHAWSMYGTKILFFGNKQLIVSIWMSYRRLCRRV